MTLDEAIKKAIKAYFDADPDELDENDAGPKTYNRKYFEEKETEFLGDKIKEKEKKKNER